MKREQRMTIGRRRRHLATGLAASQAREQFLAEQNEHLEEQARLARSLHENVRHHLFARIAQGKLQVEQDARQEERVRLARDLHDSVKQHVLALAVQIELARSLLEQDSAAAQEHLACADELSYRVQQELTELIDTWRPADLQEKAIRSGELPESVKTVVRGEAVLHARVAARTIREAARKLPPAFAELTPRELEVLHLLADGRTNAGIAAQLVLSEKTVRGYISNILRKLHLEDRTQVAVFAWQQGLMRP